MQIAVFAKAPVAGEVKTRLIPALGATGAARIHAQLVERTLATAASAAGAVVTLWVAGQTQHPAIVDLAQRFGCAIETQRGADLGARMADAFARSLAHAGRLVLIGTDCPALTVDDLHNAAALLSEHDLVLQPALDGGYVLIALRAPQPQLFESIAWGTSTVLQQTLDRAAALRLNTTLRPALPDLDTPADYALACERGWIEPLERPSRDAADAPRD